MGKSNAEVFERISGTESAQEPIDADPGTHSTPAADIGIVISGEISQELHDGVEHLLKQGDILVQMGTIHA